MVRPRLLGAVVAFASLINAQVDLGTALSFGVLGGSTVTNTGPTIVDGDVGVSPGTAIVGFPPGTITNGVIHAADAVAAQAQADITTAYNAAAAQAPTEDLTGQDLGGQTLVAGVYNFDISAQLTGALTLDGQGDPDSVWIFQIGTTLTTATASSVTLINGASFCNIFWQVGSSATLGASTSFVGNVLAQESITLITGASSNGGLYARAGAVTLDTNRVISPRNCDLIVSNVVFVFVFVFNWRCSFYFTIYKLCEHSNDTDIDGLGVDPDVDRHWDDSDVYRYRDDSDIYELRDDLDVYCFRYHADFDTLGDDSDFHGHSSQSITSFVSSLTKSTSTAFITISKPTKNCTTDVVSFTVTCPVAPTKIYSYGQVYYIPTPCTTVLAVPTAVHDMGRK
ncbi:hypothetical protein ACHAQA_003419 [Verticillium albo-atrum]